MAAKSARARKDKWAGVHMYETTERAFQGKPELCCMVASKVGNTPGRQPPGR